MGGSRLPTALSCLVLCIKSGSDVDTNHQKQVKAVLLASPGFVNADFFLSDDARVHQHQPVITGRGLRQLRRQLGHEGGVHLAPQAIQAIIALR